MTCKICRHSNIFGLKKKESWHFWCCCSRKCTYFCTYLTLSVPYFSQHLSSVFFFFLFFFFVFFFLFFICCFYLFFCLFVFVLFIIIIIIITIIITIIIIIVIIIKLSFGKKFICKVERLKVKQRRSRWDDSISGSMLLAKAYFYRMWQWKSYITKTRLFKYIENFTPEN